MPITPAKTFTICKSKVLLGNGTVDWTSEPIAVREYNFLKLWLEVEGVMTFETSTSGVYSGPATTIVVYGSNSDRHDAQWDQINAPSGHADPSVDSNAQGATYTFYREDVPTYIKVKVNAGTLSSNGSVGMAVSLRGAAYATCPISK